MKDMKHITTRTKGNRCRLGTTCEAGCGTRPNKELGRIQVMRATRFCGHWGVTAGFSAARCYRIVFWYVPLLVCGVSLHADRLGNWLTGGTNGKEPSWNAGGYGFDPWIRNIPESMKWQPPPVFLPGESHGQSNLAGYSPWGRKELDTTEAT